MGWTEFSTILAPSPIGGIGVFATHDLAKDTQIFSGTHVPRKMRIKDVPEAFIKYCVFINDEECIGPEQFDRMEIGWFLNHSYTPNIKITTEKKMIAMFDIKSGDELFLDYNELNEPEHLKEPYYERPKSS